MACTLEQNEDYMMQTKNFIYMVVSARTKRVKYKKGRVNVLAHQIIISISGKQMLESPCHVFCSVLSMMMMLLFCLICCLTAVLQTPFWGQSIQF